VEKVEEAPVGAAVVEQATLQVRQDNQVDPGEQAAPEVLVAAEAG